MGYVSISEFPMRQETEKESSEASTSSAMEKNLHVPPVQEDADGDWVTVSSKRGPQKKVWDLEFERVVSNTMVKKQWVVCPHCKGKHVTAEGKARNTYRLRCKSCNRSFSSMHIEMRLFCYC